MLVPIVSLVKSSDRKVAFCSKKINLVFPKPDSNSYSSASILFIEPSFVTMMGFILVQHRVPACIAMRHLYTPFENTRVPTS